MTSYRSSVRGIKLWLGLLLGAVCLWLALRGINWGEVLGSWAQLKVAPILGIFLMMVATHWFRARRWGVLLRHLRRVGLLELFAINAVGFLSIHLFPFRLGEFTRPLLLKRRQQVSMSTGMACVAIERVFDGLVAVGLLFVGMISIPKGQGEMSFLPVGVHALAISALLIFVPTLIFLLLAITQRDRALRVCDFCLRAVPARFRRRIREIVENFFEGLRSLPNLWSFLWILFESLGVWGVMIVAYWLGLRAFGLDLPWGAPFCILGISAIGVMIPGPPGFVGTYQLFMQASLSLFGVSRSVGLAYSLVMYAINMIYVTGAGLAFAPFLATPVRNLYTEAATERDAQPQSQCEPPLV
ncbi:MAG: lysylphosphatidylglycerol synthase transmembrane domain-containing protein [Pseudomonadota bacterium]